MHGLLLKKFNFEIQKEMANIQEQTEIHKNEVKDRIDKNRLLKIIYRVIQSKLFSGVFLSVLIANIIVLSLDHTAERNEDYTFEMDVEFYNIIFMIFYAVELILNLMLYGVKGYFKTSYFVIFDIIIVIEGFVDIIVADAVL